MPPLSIVHILLIFILLRLGTAIPFENTRVGKKSHYFYTISVSSLFVIHSAVAKIMDNQEISDAEVASLKKDGWKLHMVCRFILKTIKVSHLLIRH